MVKFKLLLTLIVFVLNGYCVSPLLTQYTSCLELKGETGVTQDGEYCLDFRHLGDDDGLFVYIYCYDMGTDAPQEFITLPAGEEGNFAKTYHGNALDTHGDMYYTKVALDVSSMEIICDDFTFGRKENYNVGTQINHKSNPYYGKAWDCKVCNDALHTGEAKMNLSGTPFHFSVDMYYARSSGSCIGEEIHSDNHQHTYVSCGGGCGGCYPAGYNVNLPRIQLFLNMSLIPREQQCICE